MYQPRTVVRQVQQKDFTYVGSSKTAARSGALGESSMPRAAGYAARRIMGFLCSRSPHRQIRYETLLSIPAHLLRGFQDVRFRVGRYSDGKVIQNGTKPGLAACKFGSNWRFDRDSVERWINEREA
jgi:hypothetical protein